jgi:hypothetical protein
MIYRFLMFVRQSVNICFDILGFLFVRANNRTGKRAKNERAMNEQASDRVATCERRNERSKNDRMSDRTSGMALDCSVDRSLARSLVRSLACSCSLARSFFVHFRSFARSLAFPVLLLASTFVKEIRRPS